MSDENKTENDDWRLDSLEEEEDIIELTEEIELPPRPGISKQDQLDEIVIDLEDEAIMAPDDEVHELMEAAQEDNGLEEVAFMDETEEPAFDLEDETVLESDDEVHELMEAAQEDNGLEDVAFMDETEELGFDLEDEAASASDEEVHELMEAAFVDTAFGEAASMEETEEVAFDLKDEGVPAFDDEVHELMESAEAVGGLDDSPLRKDDEKVDFEFEEDDSVEPFEQIEELSEAAMEEIGLEELQSGDIAEEFGPPDIETEVDIAEVADLEPIRSETPTGEPPQAEPEGFRELQEELKAEPEAVIELQQELTAELAEPMPSLNDDIIEISDFDQHYFSADEAESAVASLPATESDEEEDYLELIDVEDGEDDGAETDDEIIHFDYAETDNDALEMDDILADPDHDQFDLEPSSADDSDASPTPQSPFSDEISNESADAVLISEPEGFTEKAPAPGFFESSLLEEDTDAGIGALADSEDAGQDGVDDENGATVIPAAVSAAQIEAAVANIIERDYAGQIESMVAAAIEKVVTLEIERIKSSLFGDEED